jgi:putative tricarboxylic transport membrane protein
MLEAALSGLSQVFSWPAFGFMLLGIAVGFAVGVLPGLGGPTGLALMLPFVFVMRPVEAFSFLLGMTSVVATTGDITSVLFGIPGEPTTAATVVDGHPMAKRGEAGRALGAVLSSSLVGAIFGGLALALMIPVVTPVVRTFGSPELFVLTVLGLTFLAAVSGGNVVKGLTIATLGLLLAMVGRDPQTGTQRFTFGQIFLWDGLGLVPATVGLYAIPEIIDLANRGTSIAGQATTKLGGVFEGVRDTLRHWGLVLRCSVLGAFLGMIPGLGGVVGQWIAYAHAVQSSKDRERFGQGAVEGVIGPGAANNSKEGGNLIPAVAFGVPPSVTTAILLGAFIIQGLTPGPDMLTKNLDITYSMVWILIVSNIITVAICFAFLRPLAWITQVKGSYVIPVILVLILLGGFTASNQFADVLVTLGFGLLGWIMVELDWPRPPLVLGLVLGRLAESYLFLSVSRYEMGWLTHPWVMFGLLAIACAIVYPIFSERMSGAWRRIGVHGGR